MKAERSAAPSIRLMTAVLGLALGVASSGWASPAPVWGWRLAIDPADAHAFLDGRGAYGAPVRDARIAAVWRDNHPQFFIFYHRDEAAGSASGWGLKIATDPVDVHRFVNGLGAYGDPVKDFRIAALRKVDHPEFYVFYRTAAPGEEVVADWGWTRMSDPGQLRDFLNGDGPYGRPVTSARIAAVKRYRGREFFVFYQQTVQGTRIPNWRWKLASGAADALAYVRGEGAYGRPVAGFDLAGVLGGTREDLYVFANRGDRLWLQSPVPNERFVRGEPLALAALPTTELPVRGEGFSWYSDRDGPLGQGAKLTTANLSPGRHTLRVAGYGLIAHTPARVYADLGELYRAQPSAAEIARIREDFAFTWVDGTLADERWGAYPETFDQGSADPSKIVLAAKLDVLRHQRFSSPPPFTGGRTVYEYVKAFAPSIAARLDCQDSGAPGDGISLNRGLSVWDRRVSGTEDDWEACKVPMATPLQLWPYVSPLYVIVHEARHNDPGDSGHTSCDGKSNRDPSLEGGSGHAHAALYTMWVYRYGRYDPPEIRQAARAIATSLLGRFCSPPSHSDPRVQAIVDELVGP